MATATASKPKSAKQVKADGVIDLKTKAGQQFFDGPDCPRFGQEPRPELIDFLRGKQPYFVFGNIKLFDSNQSYNTVAVMPDGRVYGVRSEIDPDIENSIYHADLSSKSKVDTPSAMLVTIQKRTEKNKEFKQLLLLNGDENSGFTYDDNIDEPEYPLVGEFSSLDMPTTSFGCLSRFYNEDTDEALFRLSTGKLKLIDYTCDEHRPTSADDKKILRRKTNNIPTPPEPGFSLINGNKEWHRSGNTLFWDEEKGKCILLGQDEGTYFGVLLPKKAKNVADAMTVLMPKGVQGRYKRQGEWFMVPVPEEEVPKVPDCVVEADELILPRDHHDSNEHRVSASEIRVAKDHTVYAYNPSVSHDEHADIDSNGWHKFLKNTAVEAYSQKGVD